MLSEKKVVGRSVAIGLGIVCILLIALIAYFSVTGISAQNSYNNLKNQNKQLQAWLDRNETLLNQTQTWLSGNITSLQSQMNNLTSIVNLANSTVWVNNQTVSEPEAELFSIDWYDLNFSANYAGYVSINVLSANASTWTEVIYSAYGLYYDTSINVGTNGTEVFPVLPSSNITVGVGNGNEMILFPFALGYSTLANNASDVITQTISITYYY
jgi:cell division protein FtsB